MSLYDQILPGGVLLWARDGAGGRFAAAHRPALDRGCQGPPVKLEGVNWHGADNAEFSVGGLACRSLAGIAHQVSEMGFNSIRIPWSNELVETNPVVPDYAIAANPALKGKHALDVLDLTICALARENVF